MPGRTRTSSSIVYYGRDGQPITLDQFGRFHGDMDYKRVDATELPNCWVSTVWLGLDQRFGSTGPPIIFETIVFRRTDMDRLDHLVNGGGVGHELDTRRYATLAGAVHGHVAMVAKWRDWDGVDGQAD